MFQIHALPGKAFSHLSTLSPPELEQRGIQKQIVDVMPGYPCRVSLVDAAIGETVFLLNYIHQAAATPYRASHAIYIREGARQASPRPGEVPDVLSSRLISIRGFDEHHMMIEANVAEGIKLGGLLEAIFKRPEIAYVHLHNAKPGCFAASVTRAS
ncbi:DUF1203 domain-containing protein [Hyphobacterium sp.]|uniref:DUF1203 domain-containing protein n=1 Tax=Hyphobacterium sp. TaxID=2004662 RepID=UPI003BAAE749